MRNVTVTNNTAAYGGGFLQFAGNTADFGNTIIAGNFAQQQPEILFPNSKVVSLGNNLIGDSQGDAANTNLPITYQPTDILDTNPLLGQLQNNGGTTPTHALLSGSPAIDKGNNSNSPGATDQRGFTRVVNGIIDIGAFESQTPAPTPCTYSLSAASVNITQSGGASPITVTTQAGCAFTATSNNDFISVDYGSNSVGTSNVGVFVQANTTGTARTGTVTVAGQTFTVTQAAGKGKRIRIILF